jgi:hypothetical protein
MRKSSGAAFVLLCFLGACIPPRANQIASLFAGKSPDEVYMAARISLVEAQYIIKTDNRAKGVLVGEKIGVYGSTINPPPMSVRVARDGRGQTAVEISYPERFMGDPEIDRRNRKALEDLILNMRTVLR